MAGLALNIKLTANGSDVAAVAQISEKELKKLSRSAKQTKDDVAGIGASFKSLAGMAAGAFAGFSFGSMVQETLAAAKSVENYATSLQMSTQAIQEWQFAGQRAGLEADKVSDILKDVSDKIGDLAVTGGGAAIDIFEKLNLDIAEFVNMSPDDALLKIADAMDKVSLSQSEKTFLFEALGNDLTLMGPLLEDNAALLKEFSSQANETGNVLSDMDMSILREANAILSELGAEISGKATQAVVYFAEIFVESFNPIKAMWQDVKGGMAKMLEVVDYYFQSMALIGEDIWGQIKKLILGTFADIASGAGSLAGKIPGLSSFSDKLKDIGDSLTYSAGETINYAAESKKLFEQHADNVLAIDDLIEADKEEILTKTKKISLLPELNKKTVEYKGSLKDLEEQTKKADKAAEELRKEQEKQIGILNKLINEYERAADPDKDWEKVDALRDLTGEYRNIADAIYDETKALERKNEVYELSLEQQRKSIELQREASIGFGQSLTGAIESGSLSGLSDFFKSEAGQNFSFADFLGGGGSFGGVEFGDLGLGEFGSSVDNVVGKLGGMGNVISGISGIMSIAEGDLKGGLGSLGSIAGSFIPGLGPLGSVVGKFGGEMLGKALGGLGIGGSTPYEAMGFSASGSLFGGVDLAALAKNNKNNSRDVLNTEAGTFGKWQISDVLSGNQSLGQDQLKALLGVEETINEFKKGLVEYVGDIGDLFGNDLTDQFKASFDAGIDIEGENFEQAFTQWVAETGKSAIEWAKENIDTSQLDEAGKLLFEIGSAFDFNADVMKTAKASIDDISDVFNMLEIDAGNLDSALVKAAGGLAGLQASLNFFYSEFTTDDEKLADQTKKAKDALKELGAEMPKSRAEFNNMYKNDKDFIAKLSEEQLRSIDAVYDAQEKSAADAAKEADRLMQESARAYEQAANAHQKYIDDLMKGADSLNDWIMQQLTGSDSAATFSQQFQLAQAEFNRVASMGSQADAQDLQRSAETFLQLNRQGFGARGAGLEAQVLSQVQGIAAGMGGGSNEAVVALLQQLLDATQSGNADNTRQLRRMNDTRRRA